MVDSGATTKFINKCFITENRVRTRKLKEPIPLYNIDGTLNKDGSISEVAMLQMQIGDHVEKTVFTVMDIGPEDMIVGLDWLRKHNPKIDWETGSLRLLRCPETCSVKKAGQMEQAVTACDTGVRPTVRRPCEQGITLPGAPQLFVAAGHIYFQLFAEEEIKRKVVKTTEESVPKQYHKFLNVFSKEASERLPERKPYDHAIELVPGYSMFHSKMYPLSNNEQEELDMFLKEQLAKGYIWESKSPISSPFFFIKKKEGTLRPVQGYRWLNAITVKNRYPLPLIAEMVDKLHGATLFTKFDVRWGYNNVRIKADDEWKAAFITNRGLYEPLVMFFDLTNFPATFQAMMNKIFHDLIVSGKVLVYLDDILVFSTNKEEHEKVTREVLRRLQENNLFLKPEKCKWNVPKVDYVGYVFSGDEVAMDPAKLKGINKWPVPWNKKDVQKFQGFSNFYHRFIMSQCALPQSPGRPRTIPRWREPQHYVTTWLYQLRSNRTRAQLRPHFFCSIVSVAKWPLFSFWILLFFLLLFYRGNAFPCSCI
ncbi:hypothetical protein IEO21_10375 [Rhodonia placenta]|uniref:Reverse transcriptase domain-containing protein n=1 Tax=Rhodonia placenta TaxID=104341 RepID=A0A8H7NSL7_9APHY|nr:hypothetical protein IEO21_10375 [Postia placenta]